VPQADGKHDIRDWQATLTADQRRECALRAAAASGEARRTHRLFKDILKDIMSAPLETDNDCYAALQALGIKSPRQEDAVMLAAAQKASTGDIEAIRFLRDTLGEKPTEAFNLAVLDKPIRAMELNGKSDDELAALAARMESTVEALPERSEND